MTRQYAPLLLSAAGCALLLAVPAHADALDTAIATNDDPYRITLMKQRDPDTVSYEYPARAKRSFRCTGELTVGAQKGYLYRHHGIDVANGEPTSQIEGRTTCGNLTAEAGGSILLSDGRDGIPAVIQTATGTTSERLANEAWVVLSYHPSFETPVGRINLEGSVVYRATDNGQGVFSTRDDYTELVLRLGYPLTFGNLAVEPYLRSTKANPVGYNNSLYWMAEGVKIDWRYAAGLSFHLDLTYEHNVNSVTAVVHRNVWYGSATIRAELPERNWYMQTGVQFSQYAGYDRNFDFVVERDGRLLKARSSAPKEAGVEVYPFIRITRTF